VILTSTPDWAIWADVYNIWWFAEKIGILFFHT
jgi:hypothetical protein